MEKLTWPKNAENLTFFKELDFKIFQGKMPSSHPTPPPRPPTRDRPRQSASLKFVIVLSINSNYQ